MTILTKLITASFLTTHLLSAAPEMSPAPLPANARSQSSILNTSHQLDQIIAKDLADKNLQPFPIVDDSTFLRRSYINIIGRVPTYREATTFLNNTSKNKRADLIDSLIYSPGFNSSLFNYWADNFRLITRNDQHGLGWHVWLRDAVDNNMPYNKMVYSMLSASGHCSTNPATGYYLRDRNMLLDNVSNTAQVFLGTQIGCAQCHDHPFEDWTQKQYYQLAAFSGNIEFKGKSSRAKILETAAFLAKKEGIDPKLIQLVIAQQKHKPKGLNKKQRSQLRKTQSALKKYTKSFRPLFRRFNKNEVAINPNKKLKLPKDYKYNDGKPGEVVIPHPLFGTVSPSTNHQTKLQQFATWVTSPENPQFTKTIANRLWKRVFGYGLAEPVDNWTDRTKVSHPEALALVEKLLRTNHYNIRETLRVLYHTQLFQRSVNTSEVAQGKRYDFQGPVLQRMSAEQLHDSLITLLRGNIDDQKNHTLKTKWNNYCHSVNTIMKAPPTTIIALSQIANKSERSLRKVKVELRKTKLARDKALAENNKKLADECNKKLRALYKLRKQTQQNATKGVSQEMLKLINPVIKGNLAPKTKNSCEPQN